MRETIEQFRNRKYVEALSRQQSKPIILNDDFQIRPQNFEGAASGMVRISLAVGFLILCLGGTGYNSQLQFIKDGNFEKTGPCGLELGEDCRRPILYQDALSMLPIELRPVMDGIYKSKFYPDKLIVSYGRWTALPYFMLMALGAFMMFGAARSYSRDRK